jgi:cell division protein FtsB
MEAKNKVSTWLHRMRRILATACIGVLAVMIGFKVVYGANGTVEWRGKRAQYQQLQHDIEQANATHQALEDRVRKLQSDSDTIVKEAREKLGYVRPGEVVLVQPQPKTELRNSAVAQAIPSSNPPGK